MNYARWETLENIKKNLPIIMVNGKKKIKTSGLQYAYDKDYLYVDSRNNHNLIIGSTGSGKTQLITLPMLKFACLAGESVIVHDSSDEIYQTTNEMFKENKYNILKLNFEDSMDTNFWNPFELAKIYYSEGNYDRVQETLDNIGYYLLNDEKETTSDPFWINSAISYFTGICLYILDSKETLNLSRINEIDLEIRENPKKFVEKLDKHSAAYVNLLGILLAPSETRGSIFSVFSDKFKKYIVKTNLEKLLSNSDFNLFKISKEKTIIYIKSGKSNISHNLLPLFVDQVYMSKEDSNKLNIILDDFYIAKQIKDFSKMLTYSRSMYISFTIMVRGFNDLKNVYGKEEVEMLKLCFGNIVYLLSQDIETLEEICKMCGNKSKTAPLISIEELKTINFFEAIIITPRIMPFKTKLLPYFKMLKQ